jgi:hypothetical protein
MTGAAALAALLAAAAAPHPPLPPYPKALRCAGLLEAAVKGSDMVSPEARVRFDGAIFWSLAAAEVGRAGKRLAVEVEQDQRAAAAAAAPQLAAKDAAVLAELDACLKAVPPLRPVARRGSARTPPPAR